jgi:hypothetical protein
MSLQKKTVKKSFFNKNAVEAVRYALDMSSKNAKLLGLNGGARSLHFTHEIEIEEIEPVVEIEGIVEETLEETSDEQTAEVSTEEEKVEDEEPEDVLTEELTKEETESGEISTVDWDYAETLEGDSLLEYLKGFDSEFKSKAKNSKGILKAAKKFFG